MTDQATCHTHRRKRPCALCISSDMASSHPAPGRADEGEATLRAVLVPIVSDAYRRGRSNKEWDARVFVDAILRAVQAFSPPAALRVPAQTGERTAPPHGFTLSDIWTAYETGARSAREHHPASDELILRATDAYVKSVAFVPKVSGPAPSAAPERTPEYAAGWDVGPEETNAASYWAHRCIRAESQLALSRVPAPSAAPEREPVAICSTCETHLEGGVCPNPFCKSTKVKWVDAPAPSNVQTYSSAPTTPPAAPAPSGDRPIVAAGLLGFENEHCTECEGGPVVAALDSGEEFCFACFGKRFDAMAAALRKESDRPLDAEPVAGRFAGIGKLASVGAPAPRAGAVSEAAVERLTPHPNATHPMRVDPADLSTLLAAVRSLSEENARLTARAGTGTSGEVTVRPLVVVGGTPEEPEHEDGDRAVSMYLNAIADDAEDEHERTLIAYAARRLRSLDAERQRGFAAAIAEALATRTPTPPSAGTGRVTEEMIVEAHARADREIGGPAAHPTELTPWDRAFARHVAALGSGTGREVSEGEAIAAYWAHAAENADQPHPNDTLAPPPTPADVREWKRILTAARSADR